MTMVQGEARFAAMQTTLEQDVLVQIAGQLAEFDADQLFPCYGFGDTVTGHPTFIHAPF